MRQCGHCLAPLKGAWASYNGIPVCNPEPDAGLMGCYVLLRDFNHEFNCHPCQVMGGKGVQEVIVHDH
jgi:hypothetical protein